jgi:hypothetical protein
MAFSVFSAPIELRYQLFPLIITFSLETFLIAFIVREVQSASEKTRTVEAGIQKKVAFEMEKNVR